MPFYWRAGFVAAAIASSIPGQALGQQVSATSLVSYTDGMLVTSNDVTTCPYKLIGSVSMNMRAHNYRLKELEPEAIVSVFCRPPCC